ncbi:type II toxin-antitoxin system RelE/ParE family toxin [Gluconacetobacter asukensis]|uniref:Type II toxin-antitoxin system RelE/ParE family toxin n=2 Tax=Gluconacetobacter asukensis TaxID=1017181 RepID=A0A7W4P190_9PROT|nr:type II toxin-antitoxin system RelE/ParE family toxin [Gluconacetobacter asukensis]
MHSVIETPIFTRRADALLTTEERAELIRMLAENPRVGDLIPGLGGIRKMRFAGSGRGKRGGYRVIWYVASERMPVMALLLYGKNEQADLTPEQKKSLAAMAEQLKRMDRGG